MYANTNQYKVKSNFKKSNDLCLIYKYQLHV